VFQSVFPITAVNGYAEIEYVDYELQEPKFNVEECKLRGVTFASTLRVKLNLVLFDKNGSTLKKKRKVKQIIEEDVYLGQLPLMTDTGTFVINGTERVVVSQLHRSPGVIFEHDKGKTHSSARSCSLLALFLTVAHGWILSLIIMNIYMFESIVVVNYQ